MERSLFRGGKLTVLLIYWKTTSTFINRGYGETPNIFAMNLKTEKEGVSREIFGGDC
jgi:hypothetical protein